jgi:hypothetical protein
MKADLAAAERTLAEVGPGVTRGDAARESDLTFVSIRNASSFAGRGVRVSGGGQSDV